MTQNTEILLHMSNAVPVQATRLMRSDNTIDFTSDLVAMKSGIFDKMMTELEVGSDINKFDSDFYDDAIYYGLYWAEAIIEIGLQKFQKAKVRGLTTGNTTAGLTFEYETLIGKISEMENLPEVPVWAIALARIYLFAVQTGFAHENSGYYATYFMPFKPKHTLATFKTLLANINAKYNQAKTHHNRIGLKTMKYSFRMSEIYEVALESSIGKLICQYTGVTDDTAIADGTEYRALDATETLYVNMDYGVSEYIECLGALRLADDTANGVYFLTALAQAAAGETNVYEVDLNGTAFAVMLDTDNVLTFLNAFCKTQSLDYRPYNTGLYSLVAAGKVWSSGTDYEIKLYKYLVRKQRTGKYMPINKGNRAKPDLMEGKKYLANRKSRNKRTNLNKHESLFGDDSQSEDHNKLAKDAAENLDLGWRNQAAGIMIAKGVAKAVATKLAQELGKKAINTLIDELPRLIKRKE